MANFRLSAFADEADAKLDKQLAALKRNGIDRIEMRGVDGKNVSELTDDEAKLAKKKLDDAGVGFSAMGSPFGKYPIEADFTEHLNAFKRGLDICNIMGAKTIRMFSFHMPKDGSKPADWRNKVMDQLGMMLDVADKAGIKLCHENEKGIYGDTDDRCVDIMEQYGSRMGCIFDPANFIQCGVVPKTAFPKLEKYLTYMHIKDAIKETGAVVPAGMGDGSLPWILSQVNKIQGEVILTIEPHLTVFDGLAALQDEKLEHKFSYPDKETAFDAAVAAIKNVISSLQ